MAFKPAARSSTSNAAKSDDWKSVSFINIYLPVKGGTKRRKLGSIGLSENNSFQAAMHERLSQDPEALKAMVALLEFDFQVVETDVKVGDLPF